MVDPNFSGINPDHLLRTIKDLESSSKILHGAASSYSSRFQRLGLDTGHLGEIGKIAGWVDGELPMLRRRQALAAAMERDTGRRQRDALIALREPIAPAAEAREDGRRLAEDINQVADLAPSKAGAELHRIAEVLAQHQGDPDFISAFYAKTDPHLLKHLPVTIATIGAPTAESDVKVFGSAFTTAIACGHPTSGFDKAVALFHGPVSKDEPTAFFNRALMQGDDVDLWALAWKHTKIAVKKLGDPADTWSDTAGAVGSIIGTQAQYAGHFWHQAQKLDEEARRLREQRLSNLSRADKRKLKNATGRAALAARQSGREAERILGKFGMGSLSRLMEASIADGGSWLSGRLPGLSPPCSTTLFGRTLHTAGKLPLVGTVLTLGAIGWDIAHGEEKDVAIAANVGGMAAGAGMTSGAMAAVATAGGPVGWGIAAGVVLGFGVGYGASYAIKSPAGRKAVNAVTGAAEDAGEAIGDAAVRVKRTLGGWFS